jgi:hypothetical protein
MPSLDWHSAGDSGRLFFSFILNRDARFLSTALFLTLVINEKAYGVPNFPCKVVPRGTIASHRGCIHGLTVGH